MQKSNTTFEHACLEISQNLLAHMEDAHTVLAELSITLQTAITGMEPLTQNAIENKYDPKKYRRPLGPLPFNSRIKIVLNIKINYHIGYVKCGILSELDFPDIEYVLSNKD